LRGHCVFFGRPPPDFPKNPDWKSVFAACSGRDFLFSEKKFVPQVTDIKRPERKHEKNMKKNFGGLENGCIFAPAFDRGAHL
jgi:hypothetical protein